MTCRFRWVCFLFLAALALGASCRTSPASPGPVVAKTPDRSSELTRDGVPPQTSPDPGDSSASKDSDDGPLPSGQLGDEVVPTAYELEVEVDPDHIAFRGTVVIHVRVAEPVRTIWLHGEALTIDRAVVRIPADSSRPSGPGRDIAVTLPVENPGKGVIGLELAEPVPAGKAVVSLSFRGALGRTVGLFRQRSGARQYVFTDFEPIDARRAFPCFDEPRFKTPWDISLVVPAQLTALSNMPARAEESTRNGRKRVRFERTRPLPTYLVAMAAGPFDIVDVQRPANSGAGATSQKTGPKISPGLDMGPHGGYAPDQVAIRIIVPKGRASWAGPAKAMAPELLRLVADYVAAPVPYPKLDFISVPLMRGAMENPGLITVGEPILLSDPKRPSLPQQRLLGKVIAHEIAHLWFGDLVTPQNWSELWLNEGFATWLADKVLDKWDPGRHQRVERASDKHEAMELDGLARARAVRQVGRTREELQAAFDPLSYLKAGAIITMFEAWLSEKAFRTAVRAYLAEHVDGNATADSFLAVLSRSTKRELGAAFRGFLDVPGVPLVTVELACSASSGAGGARLDLRQQRFLAVTDRTRTPTGDALWQIPVCVRFDGGDGKGKTQCTLLDERSEQMALKTTGCPSWLVPNAGGVGYYRYRLPAAQTTALARARLSDVERVDLIHGLRALLYSGDITVEQALPLFGELARTRNRQVVEPVLVLATQIADHLVGPKIPAEFQAWVRRLFGPRAKAMGFEQRKGESDDESLLRPKLVGFVGRYGADRAIIAQATRRAKRWLRKGRGIQRGMIADTLTIAAFHGDAELHGRFVKAVKKGPEASRTRTRALLAGLAAFRQNELVERNLALLETLEFDQRARLVQNLLANPVARRPTLTFLAGYADKLSGREKFLLFAPAFSDLPCDDGDLAAIGALAKRADGIPAPVQEVLADLTRRNTACVAFKAAQGDSARRFFSRPR